MKKIIIHISLGLLFYPLLTSASIIPPPVTLTTTPDTYVVCKQNALLKRMQTMLPALKNYVTNSTEINTKTKNNFDKIKWYIGSSYTSESKKIEEKRKQEMVAVNEKITQARLSAQTTWKAEDSLCDFYNSKATTTTKTVKKITRK